MQVTGLAFAVAGRVTEAVAGADRCAAPGARRSGSRCRFKLRVIIMIKAVQASQVITSRTVTRVKLPL